MKSKSLSKKSNSYSHQNEVLSILKKVDAIITNDHFVYTSGKHGSVYIRKDRIYPHTELTSKICLYIADDLRDLPIQVVAGPSVGGILLSQWTAYHLSKLKNKEVLSIFTEKSYDDDEIYDRPQLFKRGYDALVKGKNVLVVEDLTNTGGSVKKVVEEVTKAGGKVIGIYVLLNRNPKELGGKIMNVPFFSLSVLEADAYNEKDCPLCKKGIPINTEAGHGKEYLRSKNIKI